MWHFTPNSSTPVRDRTGLQTISYGAPIQGGLCWRGQTWKVRMTASTSSPKYICDAIAIDPADKKLGIMVFRVGDGISFVPSEGETEYGSPRRFWTAKALKYEIGIAFKARAVALRRDRARTEFTPIPFKGPSSPLDLAPARSRLETLPTPSSPLEAVASDCPY
jgi:hypothetical protein